MTRLLNERTGTIHKPGPTDDGTACGALRHVPRRYVISVGDEGQVDDETERCGRCYEDTGGY